MSITVANRPHHHVPWLPLVVVLAAVAAAVLIALLTVGSSAPAPAAGGQQAALDAGVGTAASPAVDVALRKSCRTPWAAARGSTALAAALPMPAKYARAPWAAGGGGSPDK